MQYRKMGKWGLRLSELGLGSWITFATVLDAGHVKELMKLAFDSGVNYFDNAEVYAEGRSELLMGEALKMLPRQEIVVSTKIFWGGKGPNMSGLSRKHLLEGTQQSLQRLQLDYVDILFCHRPDPQTPIEETVEAMDYLVKNGYTLYWGTSEWSLDQFVRAYAYAQKKNLSLPCVEQPQYNLFHRNRVEREYAPLYTQCGIGTTIWSPLSSGILTGKYNAGIPHNSRLENNAWLCDHLTGQKIEIVKKLESISQEIGCSVAQMSIAWCLKNKNVSSVLLGVTSKEQLIHNLQAVHFQDKLTTDILHEIDLIVGTSDLEKH